MILWLVIQRVGLYYQTGTVLNFLGIYLKLDSMTGQTGMVKLVLWWARFNASLSVVRKLE